LRTPIAGVLRFADRVEVQPQAGSPESFDHVVFACHSNQALRILGKWATPTERVVLSDLPYGRNIAILHTDTSMLPRSRRAWASWNYRLTGDDGAAASVTYNMNLLQGLRSPHTFCVTLNDESRIDPNRVLGRFEYFHPIFTTRRAAAQARQDELLAANRTSYCGAYWGNGFHEDGVVSALKVVEAIQTLQRDREWHCQDSTLIDPQNPSVAALLDGRQKALPASGDLPVARQAVALGSDIQHLNVHRQPVRTGAAP
jgi:predicted NAD/FAD-binding protein